jgi:peptidoglycan/LPS O-acetylase OafA/YrhL
MEDRNKSLDGLRGIAALMVVLYHFLYSFYPAILTLQPAQTHTHTPFELSIGHSFLSVFFNGTFAVCIFFVLSGYALSYRFFAHNDSQSPVAGIIKRYPRLVIPVFASVLLAYVMLHLHAFSIADLGKNYTHNTTWLPKLWNFPPDFLKALSESFSEAFFYGGTLEYNPVLWTMYVEFLGSLLVFIFLLAFGGLRLRVLCYIAIGLIFLKTYLLAFLIGVALCDYRYGKFYRPIGSYLPLALALLALAGGSFFWYQYDATSKLGLLSNASPEQNQWLFIGSATLLVFSVIEKSILSQLLAARLPVFLGKISFSFYLLHLIVLGSFSAFAFRFFVETIQVNYHLSFVFTFLLSLSLIFFLSNLFTKYIDQNAIRFSTFAYKRFFERKH